MSSQVPNEPATGTSRSVLVSGASGFVGSALCDYMSQRGWEVRRLVRRTAKCSLEVEWDPEREIIAADAADGIDAVVHLAGENVSGRWTDEKKQRIRESRVKGTRLLANLISRASRPPQVLVSASAVGYYGDRGDEVLVESSAAGEDFLANVCKAWEAEAHVAAPSCRVVTPRLGVVLGPRGGALKVMATPFRFGLGGKLGNGRQYFSWISLLDVVRLVVFLVEHESLSGPVNAVAPNPVTNEKLTHALAEQLRRPSIATVPAWAARFGLGEFASEVLSSKRVSPSVALTEGFQWKHPHVEAALAWALSGNEELGVPEA